MKFENFCGFFVVKKNCIRGKLDYASCNSLHEIYIP